MQQEPLKAETTGSTYEGGFGLYFQGLLALVVVQTFRASFHSWVPLIFWETAFFFAIPLVLKRVLGNARLAKGDDYKSGLARSLQAGALITGCVVLLWQWISRSAGIGDANEIVTILVILYVAWYLAVFSSQRGFGTASFVLLNSLVLFVCFIAENSATYFMAGVFWTTSLWTLIANYWKEVDEKTLTGKGQMLPVRGVFFTFTILTVIVVITFGSSRLPEPVFRGILALLPFSGGDRGFEGKYARSGVGQGERLTGGKNAETAGPVESDQFIEDHKPSMYDILTEKFDGPVTPKKEQTRAIALDAVAKHLHEIKVMEQSGKTFRTFREKPKGKYDQPNEERISKALFFVEGETPTRFATNYYYHFDGVDWSLGDTSKAQHHLPSIELEPSVEDPWFILRNANEDQDGPTCFHCVKIMRLQSGSLPSPPMLNAWRIPDANQANLFEWNEQGMIQFDVGTIPEHTIIHLASRIPTYNKLQSSFLQPSRNVANQQWIQQPNNDTKQILRQLVSEWTRDVPKGWNQIEAITGRLRNEYQHDPQYVVDPASSDCVSDFTKSRRGPSYLFATTAVQLLREAGYPARLARGFVVRKSDYVSKLKQSIVTSENLHFWPEVYLDGHHWVALEATPGYPVPRVSRSLWQKIKESALSALLWIRNHPIFSVSILALSFSLVWFRLRIYDGLAWTLWRTCCLARPNNILSITRRLIDLRFRLAGIPRPSHRTIHSWYVQANPGLESDFFRFWQQSNYSDLVPTSASRTQIVQACSELVGQMTLMQIREYSKSKSSIHFEKVNQQLGLE